MLVSFDYYSRRQSQTTSTITPSSVPVQPSSSSATSVEIKTEPKEETKSLYVSGLLDGREEKVIVIIWLHL